MFEKLIIPVVSMADVKSALTKVAGAAKYWKRETFPETAKVASKPAISEPRTMRDSFSRGVIELSKPQVWESYVNALGQVRAGLLFDDLDRFAGYIAYKHTGHIEDDRTHRANFAVVTASFDRLLALNRVLPYTDIMLSGHISYVGKTSMECTMYMDQKEKNDKIRNIWKARVVMVATDPAINKAIPVSPLEATTPEENEIKQKGKQFRERRLRLSAVSLFKQPPDQEESDLIHKLYLQTLDPQKLSFQKRIKPSTDVWMRDTSIKGLVICQPQERNIHGKAFGGFLMRHAYEMAWAASWAFSRTRPHLVAMDDLIFRKPVPVGSMVWFHQSIGYTDGDMIQSLVTAEVGDVNDPTRRELANIFHFTLRAPLQSESLPRIIPDSYGESMLYIDSRRRMAAVREVLERKGVKFLLAEYKK